jgi:hypothetical protein
MQGTYDADVNPYPQGCALNWVAGFVSEICGSGSRITYVSHTAFSSFLGDYKEMSSILTDQKPRCGGRGGVAMSQPMSTAVHRSRNKIWRSNSIFNICSFPLPWGGTTWTGDLKCRDGKNWILRKEIMQTETLIGWKFGQTTFVSLWDRLEVACLWTLASTAGSQCLVLFQRYDFLKSCMPVILYVDWTLLEKNESSSLRSLEIC